jgi:hypothetical protein
MSLDKTFVTLAYNYKLRSLWTVWNGGIINKTNLFWTWRLEALRKCLLITFVSLAYNYKLRSLWTVWNGGIINKTNLFWTWTTGSIKKMSLDKTFVSLAYSVGNLCYIFVFDLALKIHFKWSVSKNDILYHQLTRPNQQYLF